MVASDSGSSPPQSRGIRARMSRGAFVWGGIALAAAVVAGLVLGGWLAGPRRPTTPPTIVVLEGTPGELGREHGARLARQIRYLEDRYLGRLLGGEAGRAGAVEMAADFRPYLRPHHRAELDALAEAAASRWRTWRCGGSRADAMPYPLLYRTVFEECRTVAEAIDLLASEVHA